MLWFSVWDARWCMIDYHFRKVICLIWNAKSASQAKSLKAFHTLCSDSNLSHGTGLLTFVIRSLLTQKTSIKRCLLVFTLFIHGLSPLRSRLFFRPSSHNKGISFISAQGAVVIKSQCPTYILGCQCFKPNKIHPDGSLHILTLKNSIHVPYIFCWAWIVLEYILILWVMIGSRLKNMN